MALVNRKEDKAPKRDPLERPDYIEADAQAIRALASGNASADQQRRALDFLVREVCGTYDLPFRPDSDRATAFACGKQWVGQTIVWFLNSAPTKTSPDEIAVRRAAQEGDLPS